MPATCPRYRARCLQRAHERAGAEVLYEVVLFESVVERHPVLRHVDEDHRQLGHVAQEAYPREVLAPAEELGDDEVHLLVVKLLHGAFSVLSLVYYPREFDVKEIEVPEQFLHYLCLALAVGSVRCPLAQVLETWRCHE